MSYSKKTRRFNEKLAGKTVKVREIETGVLFHIRIVSINKGYSPGNILNAAYPEEIVYYKNNPLRTTRKSNWYVVYHDIENNQTTYEFLEESTLKRWSKQR